MLKLSKKTEISIKGQTSFDKAYKIITLLSKLSLMFEDLNDIFDIVFPAQGLPIFQIKE